MKFAKELDEKSVAEWRSKYLDYKKGKKKLKAVKRAIREVDSKSPTLSRRPDFTSPFTSLRDAPVRNLLRKSPLGLNGNSQSSTAPLHQTRSRSEAPSPQWAVTGSGQNAGDATPRARPIQIGERSPLRTQESQAPPRMTRYGSIIGSPPEDTPDLYPASTLELPMPSLDPGLGKDEQPRQPPIDDDPDYDRPVSPNDESVPPEDTSSAPAPPLTQLQHVGDAYDPTTKPTDVKPPSALEARYPRLFQRLSLQRSASTPDGRPLAKRMFSFAGNKNALNQSQGQDIALEAYKELDFRKADFFLFLDRELDKIETFYKEREDEAKERLRVLRTQLHTLRERRLLDIDRAEADRHKASHRHISTVTNIGHDKIGKTSQSMAKLGTPSLPAINAHDGPETGNAASQDYQRRSRPVTYRSAQKKLKTALQELYRGLELLKTYSTLNQTAFRKINKKYDKTVANAGNGAQMGTNNYMSEKVNVAYFVKSDATDELEQDIESLYARYFERGNRKQAIGKLRAKAAKASDYGGPMLRTGLMFGIGLVLGIQGLIYAAKEYYGQPNGSVMQTNTSYLLQLYGGYFCFLALFFLFVLDSWIFEMFRVNYPYVLELEVRSNLNWRQLAEVPSAFIFLLGMFMFINFSRGVGDSWYLFWPTILIAISVLIMFIPIPRFFYSNSRKWFVVSLGRLISAPFLPVEFRDFFLGDMFCSQTYAMGNIELFFCLYATSWDNPGQCNSSHSYLLGFFSALPGVFRALQCARRYRDTHNVYPHLVNMGKYGFTILQYMTLSLWRIFERHYALKALFIAAASINSLYCIYWDILNDWSLPPLGFRKIMAFNKHKWVYQVAKVEDIILRFIWIGYVVFDRDYQVQHSSLISFAIALLEIFRRGVWVIFRVENEHCNNVKNSRATKETELPYPDAIPLGEPTPADRPFASPIESATGTRPEGITATSSQLEGQPTPSGSLRRRQGMAQDSPVARALKRVGSTVLTAHAQDYERRRPEAVKEDDSDEDEDEDSDRDE